MGHPDWAGDTRKVAPHAEDVLRALVWRGNRRGRTPPDHWFITLRDAPRHGPVRPEIRSDLDVLAARFAATV